MYIYVPTVHTISRYTQGTLTKSFMHGIFIFNHTENFMFHAWKFHIVFLYSLCFYISFFENCFNTSDSSILHLLEIIISAKLRSLNY